MYALTSDFTDHSEAAVVRVRCIAVHDMIINHIDLANLSLFYCSCFVPLINRISLPRMGTVGIECMAEWVTRRTALQLRRSIEFWLSTHRK